MENRNRTRLLVALAAILVIGLLVGTFWLLSSGAGTEQPTVADSSDEAAKPRQPEAQTDVVSTKTADTTAKTQAPPAEKTPEPTKKPDKGAARPEGEVEPDDGEEPKPKVEGEVEPPRPDGEEDSRPDPEKPITVDFVNRDVQTVMHYIALRSGLNIILQGSLDTKVTVMFRDKKPREIIKNICRANGLEMTESGDTILVKNP